MKALRESPAVFEITLENDPIEGGIAEVQYRLGRLSAPGKVIVTAEEARSIAAWFAGLAAEIEASEEV